MEYSTEEDMRDMVNAEFTSLSICVYEHCRQLAIETIHNNHDLSLENLYSTAESVLQNDLWLEEERKINVVQQFAYYKKMHFNPTRSDKENAIAIVLPHFKVFLKLMFKKVSHG